MTDQSGKRRTRISKGFIPALAFAVFGIVGGILAAAIFLQREAEDPAARTPAATVLGFVDAGFVSRDATRLVNYICDAWAPEDVLRLVDAHVAAGTSVSPGLIEQIDQSGNSLRLRTKIVVRDSITVDDQAWLLTLVNEGQWRVCAAQLMEDATPSASATPTTPG